MARLAQGTQVVEVMGAAVVEWNHVVDFLCRGVAPVLEAVLADGVLVDVGVADLSPPVVVAFVDLRITLPAPVAFVLNLRMRGTEPVVGKFWAAGVGARPGRFTRHNPHLSPRHGQAPDTDLCGVRGLGLFSYFSTTYIVSALKR